MTYLADRFTFMADFVEGATQSNLTGEILQ